MVVQGHFHAPARRDEPDLTAGEADRIDVNRRIGVDPRQPGAHTEALRCGYGRTAEQDRRQDDIAHGNSAHDSHPKTPRPDTPAASAGEMRGLSMFIGTSGPGRERP